MSDNVCKCGHELADHKIWHTATFGPKLICQQCICSSYFPLAQVKEPAKVQEGGPA